MQSQIKHVKAARGYAIHTTNTAVSGNTTPASNIPAPSSPSTPASMTISFATATNHGITPSVVSSLPGYPTNFPVLPLVGLKHNSADGTKNLIYQISSSNRKSNWTSHVPPATTTGGNASNNEGFIQINGTFYHCINAHIIQYDLSNHAYLPDSQLSHGRRDKWRDDWFCCPCQFFLGFPLCYCHWYWGVCHH
jgi:hypothetical protein